MKLLLISNSTNAGEPYLKYPMPRIDEFLGSVREVVFVPYAGITFSYAEYEAKVQARFAEYGIKVRSVHRSKDPRRMIREAQAICVGGGNTFALAKKMQQQGMSLHGGCPGTRMRTFRHEAATSAARRSAPPTTCPSSNRNRSRLSGP